MCRLPNSYNPDRTQCFNAQDEEGFSRCPQQDSLPRRLVGSNGAVRVPHPMMVVAAWLPRCIAPTLHGAMAQVPRWGASAYMIAPIGKTIILWRLMARAFLIHDVTRGLTRSSQQLTTCTGWSLVASKSERVSSFKIVCRLPRYCHSRVLRRRRKSAVLDPQHGRAILAVRRSGFRCNWSARIFWLPSRWTKRWVMRWQCAAAESSKKPPQLLRCSK